MILKMASRNIFRSRRRTLLTLATVVFGIFFALFGDGLNGGTKWQIADTFIQTDTGSFELYKTGFYDPDDMLKEPLKYPIENQNALFEFLTKQPDIIAFSPRIKMNGSLISGANELPVQILGVSPDAENTVFKRNQSICAGTFVSSGKKTAVAGSKIAALLNLKPGNTITLMARDKNRTINAYDIEISGIIKTGNTVLDSRAVFISYEFAKEFSGLEQCNNIAVLHRYKNQEILRKSLQNIKKELDNFQTEAVPWYETMRDLLSLISFREKVFMLITGIILLMAGAGIANTMLMATLERKKEIGILMACGMPRGKIMGLFLLEGVIIGLVGSIIGTIFGSLLVTYFQIYGMPLPANAKEAMESIPIPDRLYFYLDYTKVCLFFVVGVLTAALASLYPSYHATKLNPAEAVREI